MTLAEVALISKAQEQKEFLSWDRARRVISATNNAGIVARGVKIKPNMLTKPEDIIKLPWDVERKRVSEKDLEKPSQELRSLAEKHGLINQKNKRKTLTEIFLKNKAS